MFLLEPPLARALNHLLAAEPWARARLAPFAGEHCELQAQPFAPLRLRIAPDGTVEPAEGDAQASLVLRIGADAIPALARGEDHFMRAVEVSGNARLANEVLFLVRHLRWDAEEDLAAWVGDATAHRAMRTARALAAWSQEAASRMAAGAMDYAVAEKRLLLQRDELSALAREVAALRDALERLELRLERLGRR